MSPEPASALLPPSRALTACVRAFYWHDLPQNGPLSPSQRLSRIPPNPYLSLVWLVCGKAVLLESHGRRCESVLPPVFLAGPTRHGWRSVGLSAYRSFGVVFQPGAFALLTGFDVGRADMPIKDAREVGDGAWQGLLNDVAAAADHRTRVALCESFLAARWAVARRAPSPWERLSEQAWCHAARAAALRAFDWSARHFQRRTRAMTGLSPTEIGRMIRLEKALRELRDERTGRAEVAAAHGYADQPHFTRDVRRHYGRSPGELLEDVADADNHADWLLRL